VRHIVETLRSASSEAGVGLYVGCGNGRNYLPLIDAGFDLIGLDISPEAIRHRRKRRPTLPAQRLICDDFLGFQPSVAYFDYVVAIQVFQHGGDADSAAYIAKVATLLRPGGFSFA